MSWNGLEQSLADYPLLWSLGVVVVTLVLATSLYALAVALLRRWAARTDSAVDDAMVQHLHGPLRWLLPILSLSLVAPLIQVSEDVLDPVHHLLLVAVIGLVAWLLMRIIRVLEEVVQSRFDTSVEDNLQARAVHTQVRGFRNIARFLIGLLAVAFMLMTFETVRQLGVSLLASAGIAGIVVGFAAQRSIATIIAGIQVALAQPIRVDDVVIVEGEWGWIEEITLTYVVVRIWDLRRLVVPITYFIEKPFQNWTRVSADLLGTVFLYTDYRIPVDELRAELARVLEVSDKWDGKVCGLQVTNATERTLELRALMSAADSGKAWDLRCHVRERLVTFIQERFPDYLPRHRAELTPASVATSAHSSAGAAAPVSPPPSSSSSSGQA
ncbi:mechanosensitive ion channel family protein [Haliangium sp.]|uniref:mechanosensitive ion channel family protein n=1 Tax=Haliangium sp. TaxID=2663208 RepID=UPI003D0AC5A2